MKASIIAAHMLLAACAATIHSIGPERGAGDAVAPATAAATARPAACRAAAWPYLPAECGPSGPARPVRMVRAEPGR